MAKVAFDVQGTLKGYDSAKIVQLFKFLEARGHEMYVWSFGGKTMAQDAADEFGLKPRGCIAKRLMNRLIPPFMDVCVDDDRDCGLDAAREINVEDVPEDLAQLDEFVRSFGL